MKNILRKTWAKLLCFFLCVLFAATSVLSGLAILVLGEEEFYFTEKEAIIKNELYYTACDDANALIFAVSEDKHNLKTDFDSEYTTVGGWATEMLEHFPENGEEFVYKQIAVKVVKAENMLVEKLQVQYLPEEDPEDED